MSEINNLTYFLNSMKDILSFKDDKDFKEKISESKDFRIKVQKLVYLSKYFGWNSSYHFNFHTNGPYSVSLSEDYRHVDLNKKNYENIPDLDIDKFKSFIKNQNKILLEAESTILYYSNKMNVKTLTKNDSINILKSLKPHISQDDASKSFDNVVKFNLFDETIVDEKIDNNSLENIVKDKAKGLMDIYETFDTSSNRLFILGSLDFFRIVLQEADLNDMVKLELLNKFYDYCEKIEKDYFKNYSNITQFAFRDLTHLKNDFNKLEEYVSAELKIIPKFDETTDLSMFF
ncbi:hypothetical protein [Methanobrevibacter sp.]|uniref:hypothetical protein n=1 Tax=Methanobrevibacter sp. TaxID=66852 RepID=UPI00388D1E81